jgi:glycerol-3-phosphate dehydrogenase
VIEERLGVQAKARIRLVKGSHIVVPRLFEHDRAYIFQNADKRIVFAIPYQDAFTLIGTTDVDVGKRPVMAEISTAEIDYLCKAVSAYFRKPVTPGDVHWTYSGVRPLYDDGSSAAQEATRDFVLELDAPADAAPLLNVIGGKITTFRKLAEAALAKLSPHLPGAGPAWTAGASLPGGDMAVDGVPVLVERLLARCPGLGRDTAWRYARSYGTLAPGILGEASCTEDLGRQFGAGLTERELRHLVRNEWARSAEDVLWRRSKLGLRLDTQASAVLQSWLDTNLAAILSTPAAIGQ